MSINLNFYFKKLLVAIGFFYYDAKGQVQNSAEWNFEKYAQVQQNIDDNGSQNYIVIDADIKTLHQQGIFLLRSLSANAAIFYIDDSLKKFFLETNHYKFAPANNAWKFSSQLEMEQWPLVEQKSAIKSFTLIVKNVETIINLISTNKYKVKIEQVDNRINALKIKCTSYALFNEIIPLPSVLFADLYHAPHPDMMLSGFYTTINYISASDYFYPNDNGQEITIGIKENKMNADDIDLQKRVLTSSQVSQGSDLHATTISTIVGGAGNSFISGKGLASRCTFFSSSYSNLFADDDAILLQNNVSVQNHSYGTVIQPFYGAEATTYDVQTAQNKNLFHVFSCGNKGLDTPTIGSYAGINGFANITGNFKMAKNVITIAAIDTANKVAAYSSSGPMFDGRMAPQLAALGTNGTSESAAIVSGACAKLQQIYKHAHAQQLPKASLIKAVLFCTADDIDMPGIDYRTGFGALNVLNAIKCLQNNNYDSSELQQGDIWLKNIIVSSSATHLKLALSWTDTAGLVNGYKALTNDLDLELIELSTGKIYFPWCLSTFPNVDSLRQKSTRRRDTLNNAELISIDIPSPGTYEIRVKAAHIETFAKQDFNIAFTWDSASSFLFVTPLQQSDFYLTNSAAEQIKIEWLSGDTDTSKTGTLSVTMDNGNTWQIIAPSVPLVSKYFDWIVPDTNTFLQFRMYVNNTAFFSPQILLGPLTRIHVDYLCTDSFRLSWNQQPLAQSYQLSVLGDSAFMIPFLQTNDTFIVLQRNTYPENIYAVQPMLSNTTKSARSFAVDITNQGVGCMYSSFYGIPVGDIVELTLELSFPQGMDSIVIEKINANSIFEKGVTSIFPSASTLSYTVYDKSPTEGANNYRAKIWFGGHFIYTETVTIIYVVKQWLFLYPNPLIAGQSIFYSVKESSEELLLRIYSVQGKMLSQYFINSSGSFSMNHFSPGIYFYSLLNNKNEQLQQGKLLLY